MSTAASGPPAPDQPPVVATVVPPPLSADQAVNWLASNTYASLKASADKKSAAKEKRRKSQAKWVREKRAKQASKDAAEAGEAAAPESDSDSEDEDGLTWKDKFEAMKLVAEEWKAKAQAVPPAPGLLRQLKCSECPKQRCTMCEGCMKVGAVAETLAQL